jgi:phage shock protein A
MLTINHCEAAMSLFKRLTASFTARVDHLVGQIENHDAVIGAAIADARHAAARAQVRLARLQAETQRLETRLGQLRDDEQTWARRAVDCGATDQEKALECLRRRRLCQQQISGVAAALQRHQRAVAQLGADVRFAEQRISELVQQRSLLRTREATAEALHSVAELAPNLDNRLADTIERWEVRVSASELAAGSRETGCAEDSLAQEFVTQEERASLEDELAQLLAKREG